MTSTTKAIRLKGHALQTTANRGGLIAECSCGTSLSPRGHRGQTGRMAEVFGIFTGYHAREAARAAHEAHKVAVREAAV